MVAVPNFSEWRDRRPPDDRSWSIFILLAPTRFILSGCERPEARQEFHEIGCTKIVWVNSRILSLRPVIERDPFVVVLPTAAFLTAAALLTFR